MLLGLVAGLGGSGQSDKCTFQIDQRGSPGQRGRDRLKAPTTLPAATSDWAARVSRSRCRADSVAAYGGNVVHFIGNVKYRDSTLTMDADHGTYYKNGEKWEARGG